MREGERAASDRAPPAHLRRRDRPLGLVRSEAAPLTDPFETPPAAALRARRDHARAIVAGALDACGARTLLSRALLNEPLPSTEPLLVVAAGKAAEPMLDALLDFHGPQIRDAVIARGAHPVPDEASMRAAEDALRLARIANADGLRLVVLLSGGASAMLAMPADGISLAEKADLTRALLARGLPIDGINTVRKHISGIKGGQLGAAGGVSITFAISDVHTPVPDDPATIGSGPTVPDPSTFADAVRVLRSAGLWDGAAAAVRARLLRGAEGAWPETVKPGDRRLAGARFVLAGSRADAMAGAAARARALGYGVVVVEEPTLGEAKDAAARFVRRALDARLGTRRPACVIASGETTVNVHHGAPGKGGRNQEFALAAAPLLAARSGCVLASVGTDGIDGPTDAAGAIADSSTLARARDRGLDQRAALESHGSYDFFAGLGDLVVTGPTGTNVGDLQLLLFR